MKNVILATIVVMIATFTSCKMEQPIAVNYDKYAIQNDSNWIEVTDIDTLKICLGNYWIDKHLYEHQLLIKSENEYKAIFEDAKLTSGYSFLPYCDTVYQPTGVDFDKRFMIMYQFAEGDCKFSRKIYLNKLSGEYLHLTKIELISYNELLRTFTDNFSLPLINGNAKIVFDTIHVNFPW
jgi:hypothetical protein